MAALAFLINHCSYALLMIGIPAALYLYELNLAPCLNLLTFSQRNNA